MRARHFASPRKLNSQRTISRTSLLVSLIRFPPVYRVHREPNTAHWRNGGSTTATTWERRQRATPKYINGTSGSSTFSLWASFWVLTTRRTAAHTFHGPGPTARGIAISCPPRRVTRQLRMRVKRDNRFQTI